MSRTHKDRHIWKKKERKRTGKSDPEKIALHRKRFLEALAQRLAAQNGYKQVVFHALLKFFPNDEITLFQLGDYTEEIPFLVDDPASCHYVVERGLPDFNPTFESEALAQHVGRVKYEHQPCRLVEKDGEENICCSIVACSHRRWNAQKGKPYCTL